MPRGPKKKTDAQVEHYAHGSTRTNIPPAKIAAEGKIPRVPKQRYAYSPHLSPTLRFDPSGQADRIPGIVEKALAGQALTPDEQELLRALGKQAGQPWLEWAGKQEEQSRGHMEVDPVALHIHERVSAQAIVRAAMREDVQRDLFADPQQDYREAVQFYQHDVDWANRLILGDSLQVMSSLAHRENLAGKVQMIYMDPPYGIKFASNFQPEVGRRDVKDKEQDLTREPEMVKAYRDTWKLGLHSYLSYLRERLVVARELLTESGSIFVQISDENLHRVVGLLDDIFGVDNFVRLVHFRKTGSLMSDGLDEVGDYLVWYYKDYKKGHYRQLFDEKRGSVSGLSNYGLCEYSNGSRMPSSQAVAEDYKLYGLHALSSQSGGESGRFPVRFGGKTFRINSGSWKTGQAGMQRLINAGRIDSTSKRVGYVRYLEDFDLIPLTGLWNDTRGEMDARYVVQTSEKIISRCILMSTSPGDLVLDPTCGSGTSALCAEGWGRRWITIDTSRVALSLARQRIMTAKFDRYKVRGETASATGKQAVDPAPNFVYKTVPHITLGSIARNENLDPIFAKQEPLLDAAQEALNASLAKASPELRKTLLNRLAEKLQEEGLRAVTDADKRRWLLPGTAKKEIELAFAGKSKLKAKHVKDFFAAVPENARFEHWQVPFDTDPDWPRELQQAVTAYRKTWRAKMDEVNACIAANAEQEELVDQPEKVPGVLRVSGPFTVEGVRPEELSLDEEGRLFDPTPNEEEAEDAATNASAYVNRMLQLLKKDGVTFPGNKHLDFARLEALEDEHSALHGEGLWVLEDGGERADEPCNVAVAFGPQYGPVTAELVEELIRSARRYDELVVAGFSFDAAAQEILQEDGHSRLRIHMAHIRPDVSPGMDGLLKDTPNSQLFSVFGQPEVELQSAEEGEWQVELKGVDIYSPLTGEVHSTGASKVAAWFLDSDYDGRCFCVTQAFFPDQDAWGKIAKALGSAADPQAFAAFKGTVSLPFAVGRHQRIAVKVIDPRGNEVMAVRKLEGK